ncbi:MAG TPA: DUF2085 domain-containing protein, partial [Candidatus Bathyarchaeia archaeon]
ELRLCARCSGYVVGLAAPALLSADPTALSPAARLPALILLAAPLALDWVTQSWGLRESTNPVRLATGILMGLDIFLFSRLGIQSGRTIFVCAALLVASAGYLGKLKRQNNNA